MEKPLLKEAMDRTGETQASLSRALKLSRSVIQQATYRRIDAEKAGGICRYLADGANLPAEERKALFVELVNLPGRSESLSKRVSTEDPMENLWEIFHRGD